ncbi:MAG: CoA transferase, partial [Chloroflexi bacterium]|nr:CoA transferase [Chloroflexota bacterium]
MNDPVLPLLAKEGPGEVPPRPLPPWRVVELGGPAGQYCGRLLSDLGCSVIKVEPPAGDPGRQAPPLAPRAPGTEASLPFAYHNAGKRSVVIDLDSAAGQRTLRRLLLSADAVLDSLDQDQSRRLGLDPEALRQENPGLVWTSVTPFGRSGPYKDFKATDLIAFAMGGIMNVSGKPGRQPLCAPYQQAYQLACVQAAFGTLLGLWQRHFSGVGQTIEVAIVEVLASEPVLNQIARYSVAATISPRTGGQ